MDEGGLAGELRGQVQPGRGGPDEVILLRSLERGRVRNIALEAPARQQSGVADAWAWLVTERDHAILDGERTGRGVQLGGRHLQQRFARGGRRTPQNHAAGLDGLTASGIAL